MCHSCSGAGDWSQGFADLFQKHGKPGRVGARQAIELGKKGMADAGFGHTRLKSLHGGVVKAGDLSRQQAHCVRAAQCCDSRGCKPRFIEWTTNRMYMEITHDPNAIR